MMRRATVGLLLGVVTLAALGGAVAGRAWGQGDRDAELRRRPLRGMAGLGVLVEQLTADALDAGLTKESLQTDVELRLREAGVRVLTEGELLRSPGKTYLYVYVATLSLPPNDKFLQFSIAVWVREACLLDRRRDLLIRVSDAVTWEAGGIGRGGANEVRSQLRDYVNQFLNDYLAANPKK